MPVSSGDVCNFQVCLAGRDVWVYDEAEDILPQIMLGGESEIPRALVSIWATSLGFLDDGMGS